MRIYPIPSRLDHGKLLLPLLLAFAVNQAYAGTTYGAPGTPGRDGAAAGAAGTAGSDGQSLTSTIDAAAFPAPYVELLAGAGGKGGNGAPATGNVPGGRRRCRRQGRQRHRVGHRHADRLSE